MSRVTLKQLLPYAVLLSLIAVCFWQLVFTDWVFGRGDAFVYFSPYWTVRDSFLRQGQLPLWTPDLYMGSPLLADPQLGTLYPPNWLTLGLNAPNALRVSVLLHVGWAGLGMFLLARQVLKLSVKGALITAWMFALGGTLTAHAEQINQLQGLAWYPWLFWWWHRAERAPRWGIVGLGGAFALQFLAGHPQTVFIAGVGLTFYALWMGGAWGIVRLGLAGVLALLLTAPQLALTWQLIQQGERSGGLFLMKTLSFSWNPFVIGRAILPSYDSKLFSEYIILLGVSGVILAVVGMIARPLPATARPWRVWTGLGIVGVFFALGAYNPNMWWIVSLPGFNLFRVPARWLVLLAFSASALAGMGYDALIASGTGRKRARLLILPVVVVMGLALASLLTQRTSDEIVGSALPTRWTWLGWGLALVGVLGASALPVRARSVGLVGVLAFELWGASWTMPYNDVLPPDVWTKPSLTALQLQQYTQTDANGLTAEGFPPSRLMSISGLYYDPGNRAWLEARYHALGLSPVQIHYSFTATKLKESLSPNLPLVWNIPTVDGFGGGLLPTNRYNQWMEAIYPEGTTVSADGRLREALAQPSCRGACVPNLTHLDRMNVGYLLVDKVFDVWHEGIAYDTALPQAGGRWATERVFHADSVRVLAKCVTASCALPAHVSVNGDRYPLAQMPYENPEGFVLLGATLPHSQRIDAVELDTTPERIFAVSVANQSNDLFVQLTAEGWRWVLSSELKLYQRVNPLPRAYFATEVERVASIAEAQAWLRALPPTYDPRASVIVRDRDLPTLGAGGHVRVTRYHPTEVILETDGAGLVVLSDAQYDGWVAEVDGQPTEIIEVNILFRGVVVSDGTHTVRFHFRPFGDALGTD